MVYSVPGQAASSSSFGFATVIIALRADDCHLGVCCIINMSTIAILNELKRVTHDEAHLIADYLVLEIVQSLRELRWKGVLPPAGSTILIAG